MTPLATADESGSIRTRRRSVRITAAALAVGLTAGAIVSAGGGSAQAESAPRAQSVGRFLDGTAGGMAIQSLADLKDARAKAAPNTSVRNPLDATLLGQADVPIGDSLKLPGAGALAVGAANQLAVAHTDGYSYGAAGAVSNTGGADLTDDQDAYPSDATINLSSSLLGSTTIPALPTVPGLPSIPGLPDTGSFDAAALGGVAAKVGALQALAQTKSGGDIVTPQSKVADVKLALASPALAALLAQLKALLDPATLTRALGGLSSTLGSLPPPVAVPSQCALSATSPTDPISLDGGGVVIDPTDAVITVDVGKLLDTLLGKDISDLKTSNFDIITFLAKQLPTILSTGLTDVVTGITDPLKTQFTNCITALNALPVVSTVLTSVINGINTGQTALTGAIATLGDQFSTSASGPLGQLASGLEMAVNIGLNVQDGPNIEPHDKTYPFESDLAATPDQATAVVSGQSLVRAIEIDVLDAASLPTGTALPKLPGASSLPGLNSVHQTQLAGAARAVAPHALAPGGGVAVLALANAAAGPSSSPVAVTSTPAPTSSVAPENAIPTGVPAGDAAHKNATPLLPIALLLVGLTIAGGGVFAFRRRKQFGL